MIICRGIFFVIYLQSNNNKTYKNMELKENYTGEEANFMAIVSSLVGENPHTFQGQSAYWDLVEVDFENKVLNFEVFTEDEPKNLYYLMAGVCSVHGYEFEEVFTDKIK